MVARRIRIKPPPKWTGTLYTKPLSERIAQVKRDAWQYARTTIARCSMCGRSGPGGRTWATTHSLKTGHGGFSFQTRGQ